MSIGDIFGSLVAFVVLAMLFLIFLNNWRAVLRDVAQFALAWLVLGLGLLAVIIAAGVVSVALYYLYDRHMIQQCSTAYERREKAYAAPDDYFGKKLREDASAEAKRCAEFAAQKETAATSPR
jgi:hypothetical protein